MTIQRLLGEYGSGKTDWFLILWLAGWTGGEFFVSSAIIWALGGQTVLQLDPTVLQIEHSLFGIRLRSRSVSTTEVRNLRYTPASTKGRSSVASQIYFERGDKTLSFGSGISDAEAFALIDKMLTVYPFPKERALEYLESSRWI